MPPKMSEAEIEALADRACDPVPNLTLQGQLVRACDGDLARARDLLQQRGCELGTTINRRPAKIAGETNPWHESYKKADRYAAQERMMKTLGTDFCEGLAKSANVSIFGKRIN